MSTDTQNIPFLKEHYLKQVAPEIKKSRGYSNDHELPKIEKIVINSGFDSQVERGFVDELSKDIAAVAGQKPVVTKARKSISNFKLREGMPIGVKVTLRGAKMYDFLYRLTSIVLPAIRDFQGIPRKFDGRGNYTLGVSDHTIFPEINTEGNSRLIGMDITIVTSSTSDDEGFELLSLMGMPFRKKPQQAA